MTDRAGRCSRRRKAALARLFGASALTLATAGCDGTALEVSPQATGQATETSADKASAGDVMPVAEDAAASPESAVPSLQPAPELFAADEWALWNGRKTLGGRWVALPDIALARRVRLTDPETGAQVDGALIRRDPGQVGPRLIISSEAAQSLGLRPGVAAPVTIVALAYATAEAEPGDALELEGAPQPEQLAPAEDAGPPVSATAQPVAPDEVATNARSAEAVAPTANSGEATLKEAPAAKAEADQATAPETAEAPDMPDTGNGPAAATPPATPPASPPATAVVPPRIPVPRPVADGPAGAFEPGAISDGLPYIQAGIFGDPGNAARLIERLRAAGLPAEALSVMRDARSLTRVVIGPYKSIPERDQALETVRKIGPEDATPVRG